MANLGSLQAVRRVKLGVVLTSLVCSFAGSTARAQLIPGPGVPPAEPVVQPWVNLRPIAGLVSFLVPQVPDPNNRADPRPPVGGTPTTPVPPPTPKPVDPPVVTPEPPTEPTTTPPVVKPIQPPSGNTLPPSSTEPPSSTKTPSTPVTPTSQSLNVYPSAQATHVSTNLQTVTLQRTNLDDFATAANLVKTSLNPTTTGSGTTSSEYQKGYDLYWSGRTAEALVPLRMASTSTTPDARVWYYRGLAELSLGDLSAASASIDRAAALDFAGKPSALEISQALARIQGTTRRQLEDMILHRAGTIGARQVARHP